jgi:hypothetical protein
LATHRIYLRLCLARVSAITVFTSSSSSCGITVGNPSGWIPKTPAHRMPMDAQQNQRSKLIPRITQPLCQRFVDLISARYLIFRLVAHLLIKIRCTFTYTRGKNYVNTDKAVVTALHLAAMDSLKFASERGTLHVTKSIRLCRRENARVKNKLVRAPSLC